jgi:hypothetical protein
MGVVPGHGRPPDLVPAQPQPAITQLRHGGPLPRRYNRPVMPTFQLVQTVYWLALATWFGGLMFTALVWPVILTTLKEEDPTLPRVLSVNVDHDHASLLAGTLIGAMLRHMAGVQIVCAGFVLVALIAQWLVISEDSLSRLSALARCILFVAAAGMLVYDRRILWPKIWKAREQFLENADNPDAANPIRDRFNRQQQTSMLLMFLQLVLLSLMIIFSSGIMPR